MPHSTLLEALAHTDLLEIDGLHSWQFALNPEAQAPTDADAPLSREQRFLSIECMDGRRRREWHFSQAAVQAAVYSPADDSWCLMAGAQRHVLICLNGISVDEDAEDPADASDAQA